MRKGTNYTTRSFVIRAAYPIYSDKIKGNGMGRALDMYEEEREIQRWVQWVKLKEIVHLEELGVDGTKLLKMM